MEKTRDPRSYWYTQREESLWQDTISVADNLRQKQIDCDLERNTSPEDWIEDAVVIYIGRKNCMSVHAIYKYMRLIWIDKVMERRVRKFIIRKSQDYLYEIR